MASLTACLKKAGRNISSEDKASIREMAKDHRGDGMSASDAAMKAVEEMLEIALADRADLVKQIRAKGGVVADPVKTAPVLTQEVGEAQKKDVTPKNKPAKKKNWLDTLSETAKEAVFVEMRRRGDQQLAADQEARNLGAPGGQIAIGAGQFDAFIRGELIRSFMSHLGNDGMTPQEAAVATKKDVASAVEKHNAKRAKDVNWQRSTETQSFTIDDIMRSIIRASESKPTKKPSEQSRTDSIKAPKAAPPRFAEGKKLTKAERETVLSSMIDVYKEAHVEKIVKGIDSRGEEIIGYPHVPDLFVKSDITGALLRYYVTLPSGIIAHPTEVYPNISQANIDNEMLRRKEVEKQEHAALKSDIKSAEKFSSKDIMVARQGAIKRNITPENTDWTTLRVLKKGGKYFLSLQESKQKDRLARVGWVDIGTWPNIRKELAEQSRTDSLKAPKAAPKKAAPPKRIANKDNPELGTNRYSKEEIELLDAAGMDNPEKNHVPMYGDIVPERPANDRIKIDGKEIKLPDIDNPQRVESIFLSLMSIIGPKLYSGRVQGKTNLGTYSRRNGVIRGKSPSQVEIYAHEMAHYLDFHVSQNSRFTKFRQDPSFRESISELSYTKIKRLRNKEGFAEMVRVWLTKSNMLENVAPHVKKEFERILKQDKKLFKGMKKLQKDMHLYYMQGPTGYSRAQMGKDESPLIQTNKWMANHAPSLFRQHLIDRFYAASVVEGALYGKINEAHLSASKQFQLINGFEAQYEAIIRNGTVGLNAHKDGFIRTGKSLREVLMPAAKHGNKRLDAFFRYLAGRRARELRGQGREHHFTKQTQDEYIKEGEVLANGEGGYHPEFVKMAKEFQKFNERMLDYYVDMGLITKDQKKSFREANADYVPFHRVLNQLSLPPTDAASSSIGQRLHGGPQNVKEIGANIINGLFANVRAANTSYATNMLFSDIYNKPNGGDFAANITPDIKKINVQKDQMASKILEAMRAVGLGIAKGGQIISNENSAVMTDEAEILKAIKDNPLLTSFWTYGHKPRVAGGYVQGAIINGKQKWFEVHDALLIDMLSNMGPVHGGIVLKTFWLGKNFMTRTVTATSQFIGPNAIRDTSSGFAISRNKFIPLMTTLIGMGHFIGRTEKHWDFMRNRGGYGTRIQSRTESTRARRRLDLPARNGFDVMAKTFAGWDTITSTFEYGSREGDYALGGKKKDEHGRPVKSQMERAWEGRELTTDFSKHGNSADWIKFFRTVPFLNAGIQGMDKTGRIIATEEGVLGWKKIFTLDQQKKMFLAKVSVYPAITAFLWYLYSDEEWYQDLTIFERSRFYWFKTPSMDKPGKVPMAYDISIFSNIADAALRYYSDKKGPEVAKALAWSLFNTMGVGDYPGLVQPFVEWGRNKKFNDADVVPKFMENRDPYLRHWPSTPILYKYIGKELNVSPLAAEHFNKGFLRYVEHYMVDAVETLFWDEEKHGGRPFARKPIDYLTYQFVGKEVPFRTKYTDQYYEIADRAVLVDGSLNALIAKSKIRAEDQPVDPDIEEEKDAYRTDVVNRQLHKLNAAFKETNAIISEGREQIAVHWKNNQLTVPEKEKKINAIRANINRLHKEKFLQAEKLLEDAEKLKRLLILQEKTK